MSVETFDVSKDAISVSAAAASHLRKQISKRGVRISVKESGCTGYMYIMDEADESEDGDLSMTLDNGLQVFVDAKALPLLQGTQIEYEIEGVNRSIKFHNPNVTAACGCGESFNVG
tara:strand:- start:3999 stop:4346 length:348 start_codon:yes stop_codon:yes gene_type:complete